MSNRRTGKWSVLPASWLVPAALAGCLLLGAGQGTATAQEAASGPLSRGIALYTERRNDEALLELRRAVESPRTRVLGYYYAARIRLRQGNPAAARKNLLAALADSSGFHDATGLLAWANLKMGNTSDALIEWGRFVAAVGEINPGEPLTELSIMLPEEYRALLAQVPARADSAAAGPDSVITVAARPESTVGLPDSAAVGDATLDELDRRISTQIRRGYYWVGAASLLLAAGLGAVAWWLRKRRLRNLSPDFLTEVGRMTEEEDEFSLDDREIAERGLRQITRRRRESSSSPDEPRSSGPRLSASAPSRPDPGPGRPYDSDRPFPVEPAFVTEPEQSAPVPDYPAFSSRREESASGELSRQPITEEVKALVTRLRREGRDPVDIARLADLTRTEVELILAVRARAVEDLVRDAGLETEDPGASAVHRAVAELAAEGRSTVDIARSLGISTSEVKLAQAVMEKWRRKRK